MRKKTFNLLEIILIITIILVCSISLLQNKTVLGFHNYTVTSSSNKNIEKDNLILVKEIDFNTIKEKDIIVYENYNKEIIVSEVETIINNNEALKVKNDEYLVVKNQLLGKYQYKYLVFGFINKIIENKIGFALCVLIPFSSLIILEILKLYLTN